MLLIIQFHTIQAQTRTALALFSPEKLSGALQTGIVQSAEALTGNPAFMRIETVEVTGWISHPWGLKSLSVSGLSTGLKIQHFFTGIAVQHLNHRIYNETVLYAGLGRSMAKWCIMGISAYHGHSRTRSSTVSKNTGLHIGILVHLTNAFYTAYCRQQQFNPGEIYSTVHSVRCGISPTSALWLSVSYERGDILQADWQYSFSWRLTQQLDLHWQFIPGNETVHFGLTLKPSHLSFLYGAAYHTRLGMVNSMGLRFHKRKLSK